MKQRYELPPVEDALARLPVGRRGLRPLLAMRVQMARAASRQGQGGRRGGLTAQALHPVSERPRGADGRFAAWDAASSKSSEWKPAKTAAARLTRKRAAAEASELDGWLAATVLRAEHTE